MTFPAGVHTALVTPFDADGRLDLASLERLTQSQLDAGVAGVCALGGTGEPSALTIEEKLEVISCVASVVGDSASLVVGALIGTYADMSAVIAHAESVGAAGIMLMPPTFVGPDRRTVKAHFTALAAESDLPVVLFNTPTRSGVRMSAAEVSDVIEAVPNILGIKEATGDIDLAAHLLRDHGDRVQLFQGYESLIVSSMVLGAQGSFISGSNLTPGPFVELNALCAAGDWDAARALHTRLMPIVDAIYPEPNPSPLKYALAKAGIIDTPTVRRPLIEASAGAMAGLDAVAEDVALVQAEGAKL